MIELHLPPARRRNRRRPAGRSAAHRRRGRAYLTVDADPRRRARTNGIGRDQRRSGVIGRNPVKPGGNGWERQRSKMWVMRS